MKVTVWNNGNYHDNGNGYGIKVRKEDRDRYFDKTWTHINIVLIEGAEPIKCNIGQRAFWNTCRKIISVNIGKWLIKRNLGQWRKGKPPRLALIPLHDNWFMLA